MKNRVLLTATIACWTIAVFGAGEPATEPKPLIEEKLDYSLLKDWGKRTYRLADAKGIYDSPHNPVLSTSVDEEMVTMQDQLSLGELRGYKYLVQCEMTPTLPVRNLEYTTNTIDREIFGFKASRNGDTLVARIAETPYTWDMPRNGLSAYAFVRVAEMLPRKEGASWSVNWYSPDPACYSRPGEGDKKRGKPVTITYKGAVTLNIAEKDRSLVLFELTGHDAGPDRVWLDEHGKAVAFQLNQDAIFFWQP